MTSRPLLAAALAILLLALGGLPGPAWGAETPGFRDPSALRTEPYVYQPESRDQAEMFRQRVVVAGFANDIPIRVANPLTTDFTGELVLRIQEAAGVTNETHIALTVPAKSEVPLTVRATPAASAEFYGIEAILQGTAGAWTGPASTRLDFMTYPPVSVHLVEPAPRQGLATVQQLFRGGGGSGFGGSIATASPDTEIRFRALVQNHGAATVSTMLRLIYRGEKEGVGPDVNLTLAAGQSREVELQRLTSVSLEPRLASGQESRSFYFSVEQVRVAPDNREQKQQAPDFTLTKGVVSGLRSSEVVVDVRSGLNVDIEAGPSVALGGELEARMNVTNYGTQTVTRNHVVVTYAPPYHANFLTQASQAFSFRITVRPGESRLEPVPFTPYIAGRWTIEARWDDDRGPNSLATNVFSVDVPTRIDLQIPGAASTRVELGAVARTQVRLSVLDAFPDATLRIATGLPVSTDGGDGAPERAIVGGLAAQVVSAEPAQSPLGALAPGAPRWFNVSVTSRGSGSYYIVPYVVAGDYAYTGGVLGSAAAASSTNASAFLVTVLPGDAPPAVAFLPALLVLVAGFGLHFGRRRWVR
jgi:hypothetical protein